jgi:hypothetical protein
VGQTGEVPDGASVPGPLVAPVPGVGAEGAQRPEEGRVGLDGAQDPAGERPELGLEPLGGLGHDALQLGVEAHRLAVVERPEELLAVVEVLVDEGPRDRLKNEVLGRLTPVLDQATAQADRRRSDDATRAEATERLLVDEGWSAMGSFDPGERSEVLDLFGFDGQLVFATFATALFTGPDVWTTGS